MGKYISETVQQKFVRSLLIHGVMFGALTVVLLLKLFGLSNQISIIYLIIICLGFVIFDVLFIRRNRYLITQIHSVEDENVKQNSDVEMLLNQNHALQAKNVELERYAIVAQQTENAIMLMDNEGNILWVNDCFTKMYGFTYEEFIKVRGSNIRQTSFNPKIVERLNRCTNLKQPVMYEALNNCTNGEELWTHTTLSPILNDRGEVTHLVTVDSNIHKKKEARDELVNSVIHFTDRIDKLTGNLETLIRVSHRFFETSDRTHSSLEETDAILKMIRDLTSTLKLLGFNASIEANHLAEKAKGFRVIASEIVGISKDTEEATTKIREIFETIREISEKLIKDKDRTEDVFGDHRQIIEELKRELDIIESAALKLR
jgi:PAS domain S-box-containing protein